MNVPSIEVKWVPDRPRDLVQVILKLCKEDINPVSGCGDTLIEAFENLVRKIRSRAEREDDNRMRKVLEVTTR